MFKKNSTKRSFFEKITGVANEDDGRGRYEDFSPATTEFPEHGHPHHEAPLQQAASEGELPVDIYQTNTDIFIQTMPAGVRSDDLNISITPDSITISGKREGPHDVMPGDYLVQELYWGSFSRTIVLPEEVEPSEAEAIEKHGLLIVRLPKIDKAKRHRLKVKSL